MAFALAVNDTRPSVYLLIKKEEDVKGPRVLADGKAMIESGWERIDRRRLRKAMGATLAS